MTSFETKNALKRYQKFLNKIPVSDTDSCIKALKIKILDRTLKDPNTMWSDHVWWLHLKKYIHSNSNIYTTLENWFNTSQFYKDLNGFDSTNPDPLLNSVIINPESTRYQKKLPSSSTIKENNEPSKLDYLKKYTRDPQNYDTMSWKKIYRIFPCKVLVSDTQQCLEIFKVRICNQILKYPGLNSLTKVATKIHLRELRFENPELVSCVEKWYRSNQFYDDYQKFISNYPIPDTHHLLNLKIRKKPAKANLNEEIEHMKVFIFESLLDLKEKNQTREVWVSDFLNTNSFIEFAAKNQNSKSSLTRIKKWYSSDIFSKDLEAFQQNRFLSQPSKQQQGLERYKQFVKPETSSVLPAQQNVDWMKPIQKDISSILHNDIKHEKQFYDWFINRKAQIRKLTEQEIETENLTFQNISTQEQMLNWLNGSSSLSNQLLGRWKNERFTHLVVHEDHHIMPRYMSKYNVSSVKIESRWNLISLTPAMHNLIHAIRFLEYEYYEDYRVIHRIHNALKAHNLIKNSNRETIFEILENLEKFNDALRKAKFVNLNQDIQETFANNMIWQGICDYKVETITIPGGTVASFTELICLLHARFKPNEEVILPTENEVNGMRRYLNGFCPHLSNFAWQLVNLNKKMLQSINQKNRNQITRLKYHRYTVWEYQGEKFIKKLVLPPVNSQTRFIKLLENYQQHDFTKGEKQLLAKLLWSNSSFNEPVSNWELVGVYSDLSTI